MSALGPLWAGLRALWAKNWVNVRVKYPGEDARAQLGEPVDKLRRPFQSTQSPADYSVPNPLALFLSANGKSG